MLILALLLACAAPSQDTGFGVDTGDAPPMCCILRCGASADIVVDSEDECPAFAESLCTTEPRYSFESC